MKITLSDIKWKTFSIGELFSIKRGDAKDIKKRVNTSNNLNLKMPISSASAKHNSISCFTDKIMPKETIYNNVITINNNGSVGHSFYHPYNFIASSDITTLVPLEKSKFNKYTLFFISKCIEKSAKEKFAYGYKASDERIKETKFLLPVDENDMLDLQFMSEYIKTLMHNKIKLIINYYESKKAALNLDKNLTNEQLTWKPFIIGGINGVFDVESSTGGMDKNKINLKTGNIPYITRTDINNGINLFISNEQKPDFKINQGNVITVGLDTQTVFYQKHSFYTGQNIQIIKHSNLNENISLFVNTLFKQQLKKFSWGSVGATLSRIKETKITLPINQFDKPHWPLMDNNTKKITHRLIDKILKYYKKYN